MGPIAPSTLNELQGSFLVVFPTNNMLFWMNEIWSCPANFL